MHPITRELLDYLDAQRGVLRAAYLACPPRDREREPEPGRWSVAGVIEHLGIVESRIASRAAAKIEEARAAGVGREERTGSILPSINVSGLLNRSVRVSAPDPVQPTRIDAESAWSALESGGERVRATLMGADGLALGGITMSHPYFGERSLYWFFAFVGAHEARHAAQIREISAVLGAATE